MNNHPQNRGRDTASPFSAVSRMFPRAVRGAGKALRTGRDLVFPRRCPVCDRPVRPFGALICPDCVPLLERVREPVCRRCGKPLSGYSGQFCPDCLRIPHLYDRGCAVFTYHSVSGGLFRFKYEGRREYAACYGQFMAQTLEHFCMQLPAVQAGSGAQSARAQGSPVTAAAPIDSPVQPVRVQGPGAAASLFDMLVPVPVSAGRLRKRGYNQALLLAREISGRTGIPVREDVLRRTMDTAPMKTMGPEERQNNLKKAFQCSGNDVKLRSIMLIDDIYTTGATIDACAGALYRRGAARVCFIVLAIGDREE